MLAAAARGSRWSRVGQSRSQEAITYQTFLGRRAVWRLCFGAAVAGSYLCPRRDLIGEEQGDLAWEKQKNPLVLPHSAYTLQPRNGTQTATAKVGLRREGRAQFSVVCTDNNMKQLWAAELLGLDMFSPRNWGMQRAGIALPLLRTHHPYFFPYKHMLAIISWGGSGKTLQWSG